MTVQRPETWWGEFAIAQQQALRWRIGPLDLSIGCTPHEWRIAYMRDGGTDENQVSWDVSPAALPPLDSPNLERHAFPVPHGRIRIEPALADRPLVTRPLVPLHIPSGLDATIYVSSPVWVRIATLDPERPLQETATQRASDTWFGPSTREGELCYAGRTHARLSLDELSLRPHRVVTPVTIHNRGRSALLLDRLSLPVPMLSIYASAGGMLWTEALSLAHEENEPLSQVTIGTGAAPQAAKPLLLAGPREQTERNVLVRAFSALFD